MNVQCVFGLYMARLDPFDRLGLSAESSVERYHRYGQPFRQICKIDKGIVQKCKIVSKTRTSFFENHGQQYIFMQCQKVAFFLLFT